MTHEEKQLIVTDTGEIVKWNVFLVGKQKPRTIEAVYSKIDGGAVYFRMPTRGGYPICVACFAAGQWVSIERVIP